MMAGDRNIPTLMPPGAADSGAALPVSERLLHGVSELSDYAICLLDPSGNILTWNSGAERLLNHTADEVIGRHLSCLFPPEAGTARDLEFALAQAQHHGRFEEVGWLQRKGQQTRLHSAVTPVLNSRQQTEGFLVVTREADEPYRLLVGALQGYGIFLLDSEGKIQTWNAGAELLHGFAAHEIVGQHISAIYSHDDVAAGSPGADLQRALQDTVVEQEGWRARKDGSLFWASVTLTALRTQGGRVTRFSVVIRDLTERRTAEEALRASEERYRLLVAGVKDYAIFMLDTEGYVVTWNEGALRLKGYSAGEIIGRHFSTFYPEEAVAVRWPWEELERAKRDGRIEDEGWRVRKDGSRFWANVVITALRNATGHLIGFSKVTRDLSERRAAEEALRESEERYRLIVAGVKDYAIFMLDTEGNVVTWNEGAQRLKGYTAGEIIGRHFSQFYPPESIATRWPWEELERVKRDGRLEDEGWRVRKDGSRFWANVVITALRDETGRLVGFSKVTRDLSDRWRAEQEIRALNEELQRKVDALAEANRVVMEKSAENEAFVYSVSHDLRSPLVNLQGFSHEIVFAAGDLREILAGHLPSEIRERAESVMESGIADSVKHVQTAVAHLSAIIEGLLRLSRAGRVEYQWTRVPLNSVVERIVTSLSGTVGQRNADIEVHDLPDVWGDPPALEQLFSNLISNALNYLDPGRKGRITVGSAPVTDGEFLLFVRDNGVGLTASAQSRLFRVFQRFHPDLGPGEGMGLAIAHRIVERHNGRIWVESSVGQGATFFVALPFTQGQTSGQNSDGASN